MTPIRLEDYRAAVRERKRLLGITDAKLEAARNGGGRRTPEKIALLDAIERRAREAGVEPLPAKR